MFNLLKKVFLSAPTYQKTDAERINSNELDAPRYPPTDNGLPLVTIEEIINSQEEILTRIHRTAGLTPDDYAKLFQPIIYNFARYVHLLPATNTGNHRGAGGLFRMGLELGLYSLQVANSTSFVSKNSSAEARFRNHPKWAFATFVAAICSEIYRPISNMVVLDDEGNKWTQLLCPLYDWAAKNKKSRYFIVWNAQNGDEVGFQQANAAYMLTAIVPHTSLQYLSDGDSDIMLSMTSCVTGAQGGNSQIKKIVDSIRHKIIQRDLKTNSERYGLQIVGAHLEPHLLDAMRRLLRDGTWTVNTKGARIWYSSNDGLFVVWQAAVREIVKLFEKDGRQGIPQDADTLAEILIACGAAELTDAGERYWTIQIPLSMQLLSAIRITLPEILIQNSEIQPSDAKLLFDATVEQSKEFTQPGLETVDRETGEIRAMPTSTETEGSIVKTLPENETQPHRDALSKTSEASQNSEATVNAENKGLVITGESSQPQKTQTEIEVDFKKIQEPQTKHPDPPKTTPKRMGASVTSVAKPVTSILTPKQAGLSKEKVIPLGLRQAELLGALKPDNREYLHAILDDHLKCRSSGAVFCVDQGMAISTEELNSHGQVNCTGLLQALSNKHWLWEDTENFPNGKKLHEVEHAGKMIKIMIIKPEIAREIGFDWKGIKK